MGTKLFREDGKEKETIRYITKNVGRSFSLTFKDLYWKELDLMREMFGNRQPYNYLRVYIALDTFTYKTAERVVSTLENDCYTGRGHSVTRLQVAKLLQIWHKKGYLKRRRIRIYDEQLKIVYDPYGYCRNGKKLMLEQTKNLYEGGG